MKPLLLLVTPTVSGCNNKTDQEETAEVRTVREKAEQGFAEAQYNLGVMYERGEGVAQDKAEAVTWCRKAAKQEHAEAKFSLGVMYHNGEGVPEDKVQAFAWMLVATRAAMDATGDGNREKQELQVVKIIASSAESVGHLRFRQSANVG